MNIQHNKVGQVLQTNKRLGTFLVGIAAFAIVALPVTVEAQTTTTVSSAIGSTISLLTSSGTVSLNSTPTGAGVQTIASDTVTVSTNNTGGYTLQIGNSDTDTDLESGANTIPASSGTQGTPAAQAVNTWGYRVDGVGGFGAGPTSGQTNAAIGSITFAGVPSSASPNTIATTGSTATEDETVVWYGLAVDTETPSGTYSDEITYTATTN